MIRLRDLLLENPENRINLMKIQTIMEKMYPVLNDTQVKKLMELCAEAHIMASQLNMKPFVRTESTMVEWKFLISGVHAKINELKVEVLKIAESDKTVNCAPLIKALDEVLAY